MKLMGGARFWSCLELWKTKNLNNVLECTGLGSIRCQPLQPLAASRFCMILHVSKHPRRLLRSYVEK